MQAYNHVHNKDMTWPPANACDLAGGCISLAAVTHVAVTRRCGVQNSAHLTDTSRLRRHASKLTPTSRTPRKFGNPACSFVSGALTPVYAQVLLAFAEKNNCPCPSQRVLTHSGLWICGSNLKHYEGCHGDLPSGSVVPERSRSCAAEGATSPQARECPGQGHPTLPLKPKVRWQQPA
eukprot:1159420-Pelagomonas_calceolata.AAC.4